MLTALQSLPAAPAGRAGWPWTESPDAATAAPNGQSWPRWTVVIPSLNQGRYIEEAIRSVLLQRYPDLELMVMDGGSADETVEVIRNYEQWITHWESCKDRGQSHAINKGFARATGEVLSFLNSDDVLLPGAAFAGISALVANASAGIAYGNTHLVQGGSIISEWKMQPFSERSLLHKRGPVVFHMPFIRRSTLDRCGLFDECLHFAFDYEYTCRLMRAGIQPIVVEQHIANFRVHESSKTSGAINDTRYFDEEAAVCQQYGGPWLNYARRTSLRVRARAAIEKSPLAFALRAYRLVKKRTAGAK